MRITGGKYRGRQIESRPDRSLRPSSSRVREAIFNLLRHGKFMNLETFVHDKNPDLVEGRRVVDIFCGTGALGIEALSRGAEHVTLVDQNQSVLGLARSNVERLGEGQNLRVVRSDSTQLPRAHTACDLAFVDPPYQSGLALPAVKSLDSQQWLEKGAVVVVELGKKDPFIAPENFTLLEERVYNITRIVILQYQSKISD